MLDGDMPLWVDIDICSPLSSALVSPNAWTRRHAVSPRGAGKGQCITGAQNPGPPRHPKSAERHFRCSYVHHWQSRRDGERLLSVVRSARNSQAFRNFGIQLSEAA
jgi:hypothetical protein